MKTQMGDSPVTCGTSSSSPCAGKATATGVDPQKQGNVRCAAGVFCSSGEQCCGSGSNWWCCKVDAITGGKLTCGTEKYAQDACTVVTKVGSTGQASTGVTCQASYQSGNYVCQGLGGNDEVCCSLSNQYWCCPPHELARSTPKTSASTSSRSSVRSNQKATFATRATPQAPLPQVNRRTGAAGNSAAQALPCAVGTAFHGCAVNRVRPAAGNGAAVRPAKLEYVGPPPRPARGMPGPFRSYQRWLSPCPSHCQEKSEQYVQDHL